MIWCGDHLFSGYRRTRRGPFCDRKKLQELQGQQNMKLGEMAVLYRTNTQSRIFEEMLIKSGITYNMVGGLKFYDRKEIKDIIAYLRVSF